MRLPILIFCLEYVCGEITFKSLSINDKCNVICKANGDELPKLEPEHYEHAVCFEGCFYFGTITNNEEENFTNGLRLSDKYCNTTYILADEKEACYQGRNLMYRKKLNMLQLESSNKIDGEETASTEADLESVETDVLADPIFLNQLEFSEEVIYKIPQTNIQTMPIEAREDTKTPPEEKLDWLDCASKNSGIPRWVLLIAIFTAVLAALCMGCISEKREDDGEVMEIVVGGETLYCWVPKEKRPDLLEDCPGDVDFYKPVDLIPVSEKV